MPSAESMRLAELAGYLPGQDEPDADLNRVADLAARLLRAPIAGISLVDGRHVWLKARVGVEAECLEREGAFCGHAVDSGRSTFLVDDTRTDPRFVSNPLVTADPFVRSYAAAVLRGNAGYGLGTLWIMDKQPRSLDDTELELLQALAALAGQRLLLRHQDPVTQLPTRAAFLQRLRRVVEQRDAMDADASPDKVLVGHIDLRNLALVRSAYSPETCERLLQVLADRLRQWVGPTDLLAHLDGDHFCFALQCNAAVGNRRLHELEDLLARPVNLDAAWIHVASVVGVSMFAGGQGHASALLDQAAVAASTAMPIETNPVRIYQPRHSEQTRLWVDFQHAFPRGLAEQRVFPLYQPQIDVVSGDLAGFEALARYCHESEGVIGPGEFLELARHTGMLRALDLAILDAVCADLLRWRKAGLRQVPVAVNFSRATIKLPSTADAVAQIMAQHDVTPDMLVIEIVEDGEFVSTEELRHTCERLVASGVRVALDDFGTGRANLAALHDLRLHYLKVDRRFVHGVSLSAYAGGVLRLVA